MIYGSQKNPDGLFSESSTLDTVLGTHLVSTFSTLFVTDVLMSMAEDCKEMIEKKSPYLLDDFDEFEDDYMTPFKTILKDKTIDCDPQIKKAVEPLVAQEEIFQKFLGDDGQVPACLALRQAEKNIKWMKACVLIEPTKNRFEITLW